MTREKQAACEHRARARTALVLSESRASGGEGMKMKRALALIALATVIGVGLAACDRYATAAAPETVKPPTAEKWLMVKPIREGETVWEVCARVAGPEDDLQTLVLQTLKNNHLEGKAETLQIGQELRIRVKAPKEKAR